MTTYLDTFGNPTKTLYAALRELVEVGDAELYLERVKSPQKAPQHQAVLEVGGFIRQSDKSARVYPLTVDIWSSGELIDHLDYVAELSDRVANSGDSLSGNIQSLTLITVMRFSQKTGETAYNSTLSIDAFMRALNL